MSRNFLIMQGPKESKKLLSEARQRQRNDAVSIWNDLVAGFGVGGEEMDHFSFKKKGTWKKEPVGFRRKKQI